MNIEQQVVNLELSKRLKELGVKQESLFYWVVLDKNHPLYEVHYKTTPQGNLERLLNGKVIYGKDPYEKTCGEFIHYSAFTVAELGELLPPNCADSYKTERGEGRWDIVASLYECDDLNEINRFVSSTEADARAKMLIHLIENNLLKL